MRTEQERTVNLSQEVSDLLDQQLASGDFMNEQDALKAGLIALNVESLEPYISDEELRREVLPVIEAMRKDPSRGLKSSQVIDRLAALHSEYLRTH